MPNKPLHIDREFLTATLVDLIRINSVNPTLVEGAPGEAEIAGYVGDLLKSLGLEVTYHEPEPGRVSVVGRLPGRGAGRSVMLNAHVDTVGVQGMDDPFSAVVRNGRMYGRGAYDMKGALAACLAVAKSIVDAASIPGGNLLIAAVADEEYASLGTREVLRHHRVDGAIVTEPTALNLCLAHKGFIWLNVDVKGRAAHGSRYDLGIDANLRLGRFLHALEDFEPDLRKRPGHPLVGPPSLHVALLHGGTGLSTYASHARAQIERRTVPGETAEQVAAELKAIVDRLHREDPTFEAGVEAFFVREPFEVQPEAQIVQSVRRAAADILGRQPEVVGENPWMDSALLAAAGVETVVIGPDGGGAHAAEEWVDLQSAETLARILAHAVLDYTRAS